MNERLRDFWIPGACFVSALGAALLLAGAVLVAPWLAGAAVEHSLAALFAGDLAVRRTALASAVGLAATAFIFFRPVGWFRVRASTTEATNKVAGA
jgi:hypothetical protein